MADASRLHVAIAQIDCQLGNLAANLDKHLHYIDAARTRGVELLLFPELSLTGYRLGNTIIDVALNRDDALIGRIADAAADMTVVLGFVEEGPAAQFYNSAVALSGGKLVFLHRKLNLPTYGNLEEGKLFAAGSYVETFAPTRPWRAGVLICADLWNPALVHLAMVHGATLLLAPVNSAVDAVGAEFSNPHGWRLTTDFYSMIYAMPILMANRVGVEDGVHFWGGSRIVDPYGRVVAEADNESECLLEATLDYQDVRQARFQLPTVRDSNLNLVRREMERLAINTGVPTFLRPS